MNDFGAMLGAWNGFYVMVGSSAAALTGLMFVVVTLVSDQENRASEDGLATFSTPTVVHFCCVLLTAAILAAPFRSIVPVAIALAVVGAFGTIYVARVGIRAARLPTYRPDWEDWSFNVLLPFLGYATLIVTAIALHAAPAEALYAPAATVMLLVFVGIHNAWDVVTWIATGKAVPDTAAGDPDRAHAAE